LRKALASGPTLARLGAAVALGEGGEAGRVATPELLEALKDKDPRLRAAAIGSLAALGIPAKNYTDSLLALVEDPDEKVRAAAVSAAGKMDKDQLARLVPVLKKSRSDSSVEIRRAAASSLAEVGAAAAEARPGLQAALKDADPLVRALAARALGALGGSGRELVDDLLALLGQKDPAVRLAAVEALGGFSGGVEDSMGPLLALAVSGDEPENLRLATIEALSRTAPKARAVQDALVSMLKKAPVKIRMASARALVSCRPDPGGAVAALAAAVRDDNPDVRRAAVESVGEIGPAAQGAAEAVFGLLGNEYTRAMGFAALKKIQPRDVSLLRRALGHEDRYVRGFACDCLGKLGKDARDALADLRKATRTRSRTLRDIATKAIRKIEEDIERGQ
jgi:HEAT repeat protein